MTSAIRSPRLRHVVSASLLLLFVLVLPARSDAQPPFALLRIIAPAAPGGGWDQTARVMQAVLQQSGLVHTASVENITGAAGTIGLARFVGAERGADDVVMVSGLIMLSGIVTNGSPLTLRDVTPIARLTGEYEALVVPLASPFQSFADLVTAFKAHPESVSWGGGSAGGSDQILAGLVADAVGVEPRRVNYIAFSGGGEAMAAILGGQVSVGINGLAEFLPQIEARSVRVLAISSRSRLPGLDAPTLREQGVDVEFESWRSLVAAPGIAAAQRARIAGMVDAMVHSPGWRSALTRYRWIDRYLAGEEFEQFVSAEDARVRGILNKLGLGAAASVQHAPLRVYPAVVVLGLAAFGIATVFSVLRRRERSKEPRSVTWQSAAFVSTAMLLALVLMEAAGFVIASAVLFWLTAQAFDRAHPWRDAVFAAGISLGAYLLFVRVLHVALPPVHVPFQ